MPLNNKNILLIITGGIAAYKSLELIRLLKKSGASVRCILTKGGAEFVTPLSVSALSEHPVYTDLWSLKDESEMGHIRLSREADLIIIAPCSANMISKMVHGAADDLATTTLLAANKPIMIAPAMNVEMWHNEATQENLKTLAARGMMIVEPTKGDMACGETGIGRMVEPSEILQRTENFFELSNALKGKHALVTAGATIEPLDPVRFLSNFSSGKQGYAIASALKAAGAEVTLISAPTNLRVPADMNVIAVQTADEMNMAAAKALHNKIDIAICVAAVADFAPVTTADKKIKKTDAETMILTLRKNPDILKMIAHSKNRPALVIGFAAETDHAIENAQEKLKNKNCDWILLNCVGQKDSPVFGEDHNSVSLITPNTIEDFGTHSKSTIAHKLILKIVDSFKTKNKGENNVSPTKKIS